MTLPKLLAILMIVFTMFGAGLQVDMARVRDALRDYGLIGRALLADFVLVPLFAVALVRLFRTEAGIATGIVLMSMAPGVPFLVNAAGRKQGGSMSFALIISFCFAALSVVTIPITLQLALPDVTRAQIPIVSFMTTLVVFQLIPLVVGAMVAPRLSEEAAGRIVRVTHIIFLVAAVALLVVVAPKIAASFASVYGYGRLLIIVAIGLFSMGAGWLLGGPKTDYRRTLSIATLMRNIGICALICSGDSFANTLALPAVITYFIITFAMSLPLRAYFSRTKGRLVGQPGASTP